MEGSPNIYFPDYYIKKYQMSGEFGTEKERCIQGFGGETNGKETIRKTQA
jgi:hypothetical protein